MQIRCPQCRTLFRLRPEYLEVAGGRVPATAAAERLLLFLDNKT